MKRLSWKYIAGFVDGEGCLDMQFTKDGKTGEYKYIRPRMRIGLSEPGRAVLDMLLANHGGNIYVKNLEGHGKFNANWKAHHYWQLEGKRLRPFIQNIVNHLEIKKEQARLVIWMIDNVMGKHVPDGVRELLKDELKAMKSDPQRLSERAVQELSKMMGDAPWSRYSASCKGCDSDTVKHHSKGYCEKCYNRIRRKELY